MAYKFLQSERNMSLFTLNRSVLATAVVLAVGALLIPSLAYSITLATTQVGKLCEVQAGGGYEIDQVSNNPQPYEQTTACNISTSGTVPYTNDPASAHAEGYASAGFGNGVSQVGTTSAGSQVAAVNGTGSAGLFAHVQYFFEIQPVNTAPGTLPSLFPVLFSASGGYTAESSVGSLTRAQGIAHLYGPPLATYEASFQFDTSLVENVNLAGGFDGTKALSLYANYSYGVDITAACYNYGISASCSSWVDSSIITFDQTAFDALMGENTYNLDDYYTIAYSPNIVPIPSAVWLFGSGLIGLVGVARRKNND